MKRTYNFSRLFLLICIISMLSACATFRSENENRKLLRKNIDMWKSFTMKGVASINYKSFVFRKDFVARSNGKVLRADLIGGGLFGASPSPFASVYVDSVIVLKPPFGMPSRTQKIKGYESFADVWDFLEEKIKDNEQLLLSDYAYIDKESEIFLNTDYQLKEIILIDKTKIEFAYNSQSLPKSIIVTSKGKELLHLIIDSFESEVKGITPIS